MRLPRSLLAVLTASVVVLTLGATAEASGDRAKPVQPKSGVWEAAPKGVSSYSLGGWTLGRVGGRIHMTADPDFGGTYYPNADKCHVTFNPPLTQPDYRLGTKGRFKITDREANTTLKGKPLVQHVIWIGKFSSKRRVAGTISIWMTKAPAGRSDAKPKVVCRDMHRHWSGSTP